MVLVTVNFGESPETVRKAVKERGYEFPVLLDEKGVAMGAFQVFYRPATFLIGADGKVRSLWVGPVSAEQWEAELQK